MTTDHGKVASPKVLLVVFVAVAVVLGFAAVKVILCLGSDWKQRAEIGEMLAGVGAVLSVLSFGALLFTVWIQHRQYELQQRELVNAREAQKETSQVLSKQIKMLRQSAECQALNTLVIQAEETINRFNDAQQKGLTQLVELMQPAMADVSARRSAYVERLRVIVAELSQDSPTA
jgi:hypothetical protein